jgi:hypothetical protein
MKLGGQVGLQLLSNLPSRCVRLISGSLFTTGSTPCMCCMQFADRILVLGILLTDHQRLITGHTAK